MHIPLIPLRRTTLKSEPLPVAMSGVRMGERVLQVGTDNPKIVGTIAAKVGISGHAAVLVSNDSQAALVRKAVENATALADIRIGSLNTLPFPDAAFDAAVVHGRSGLLSTLNPGARGSALIEVFRVLRPGGRVVVIEAGTPTGFASLLRSRSRIDPGSIGAESTVATLERAGFKPARSIADREGMLFSEGIKGSSGQDRPATPPSNQA